MFTDYDKVVEYLYNSVPIFQQQGAAAYKPGLQTTHALDEYFGRPHETYKTIHVAGTNGKGSCCHMLAAMFQGAGYKTGLYTSPHLLDMRERIRVNGRMIPKQNVVDFVNKHRHFFEPLHPSFFELTTAMAFSFFAEEGVEIAIIETGLGGRLDCTNIIRPEISIITNVSLDHTQLLGQTISEIAKEKAGIIKAGVPVVIGESSPETRAVYKNMAAAVGAKIIFAEDEPEITETCLQTSGSLAYKYFTNSYGTINAELAGSWQPKNTNTALVAVRELQKNTPTLRADISALESCSKMTGLMGRWQKLSSQPDVFCDTGHNIGGWEYISRQLSDLAKAHDKLHVIFGMAADKDVEKVLELLPRDATFYWTAASVRRAMPAAQLRLLAVKKNLQGNAFYTVKSAVEKARSAAKPQDAIFIGGSTFVVAEALPLF